jgi:methionyl-tRNA synthetase
MSKQVKRVQPTLYLQPSLKQLELESSLKALLAIQAANIDVKQASTKYDHFSQSVILDLPENNIVLFEPSAIVKYLLKEKTDNLNSKDLATVNSWIEFDEFTLSKLVSKESTDNLDAALEKIENTLKTNNKQLGKVPSELVDIAIFSSLFVGLSYKKFDITKYPNIKEWMNEKLQNQANIYVSATRKWGRIMGFPAEQKVDTKNSITLNHHDRIILPVNDKKNILVTSALPYVNNVPHLGNIVGAMLSADCFTRYGRLRDYNIIFINGTDEYGTATETKALEEKCTCQELCDKYHALHKEIYQWFGIDFDYFGRTTTEKQTEVAQDIFLKLHKNGYLLEDTVTQLYCETCKLFLADRFVEGECPFCHYDDARGDQCDKCGKLINAVELIKPRCKVCNNTPKTKTSEHIFIDLPKLQDKCEAFVKKNSVEGEWSSNSISITNGWLKEGLKPRCITRDLKWGTPVPLEKYKDKVFYVWFDAPIGYISMTANYTPEWKQWWMNPDNVQLYQFMGKDNIPFHTVIFPCSEIGTGDNYTLLNRLSTTEYLNYENGKFSKSRNVGVFGNNVVETGVPVEVWRYYLLINRPESNDSAFTWNDFISRNNNELLANIGNFVNRLLKFVAAKYDSIIPEYDLSGPIEQKLIEDVNKLLKEYIHNMEVCKLRAGLKTAMDISQVGNAYLQENKIDNKLFTEKREICNNVVAASVNLIYLLSSLVYPFMPTTTESILKQINAPLRKITDVWEANEILPGHTIGKPAYLFKRIDPEMENIWREKYGGNAPKESKPAAKKQKKASKENKTSKN